MSTGVMMAAWEAWRAAAGDAAVLVTVAYRVDTGVPVLIVTRLGDDVSVAHLCEVR